MYSLPVSLEKFVAGDGVNDIDNNNNYYNKIEEDDGGEFSDSDNEWGDIATPRRLVDSTANTKSVHVPPQS